MVPNRQNNKQNSMESALANKRLVAAAVLAYALLHGMAATATTLSFGSDYFSWREFDESGSKLLEETGMRYFLSFDGMMNPEADLRFGIGAKIYAAEVDYDGQDQSGIPAISSTDYVGFNGEMRIHAAISGSRFLDRARWYVVVAGGGDAWQRDIHSIPGVASGYVEDYTLFYGRIGLLREVKETGGLLLSFGVKMPVYIHEQVLLGDGVTLNPTGQPSGYMSLGMKLFERLTVRVSYDSYLFDSSDRSDPVKLNGAYMDLNGDGVVPDRVYQPESSQHTIGVSFEVLF